MSSLGTRIPNQKLTRSQKISKFKSEEKWGEDVMKTILDSDRANAANQKYDTAYRDQVNYDLVAGIFNKEDLEYVEKPYGNSYSFPANLTHYDLISPKINVLGGEEIKRPFNFRVISTNPDSVSNLEKEKKDMVVAKAMNGLIDDLKSQRGIESSEQQQEIPEDIDKYLQYSYKELGEANGQKALDYLYKKLRIKPLFTVGWKDLLIAGKEIYKVGILSGEPNIRSVNPLYFDYDHSPNQRYIEDSAWVRETRFLSAPDIYDEFYDILTPEEVGRIEDMKAGDDLTVSDAGVTGQMEYKNSPGNYGGDLEASDIHLRVEHVEWRSLRRIGVLKFFNESGELDEMFVDEDYKHTKDESVEWIWVDEAWEGTRIAKDIYKRIRPIPNQRKSVMNPSVCKLTYCGLIHNNRNSRAYSLVEIMKPHQYLYNIMMYRLELEIARAKGKKMIMDIAQIPRSWGFDIDKWLYYFDAMGIAWVNSFEEGDGKFEGRTSSFNQMTDIDLSLGRIIDQYVAILDKIESMLDDVSGITPQREGAVHQSETVGGIERAITQSSHITEPLFAIHNEVKTNVMQALLDTAKVAWADGKQLSYITDDFSRSFFSINGDDFTTTDFDVFVSDTTKDARNIEILKSMVQPMIQNGMPVSAAADLLMKDSIVDIKKGLQKVEAEMGQREQQAQQAEMEAQAQIQQQQLQLELFKEESEDKRNVRDNQTKLQIALLNQGQDEGEDSSSEERKVNLQEKKIEGDLELKNKQLEETIKQNAAELGLKEKELQVKKMQAKKAITAKNTSK